LSESNAYERYGKAGVLRRVMNGVLPTFNMRDKLPLNLQKAEKLAWVFVNAEYFEDRTRHQYVGRSAGVSVRIAKGIYYHTSGFQGRPIDVSETIQLDTGMLVLTDKNIYFTGPKESLRIPYNKIVAFHPYSNGFGIVRDAASAKGQGFVNGDGWFSYNLVTNLARL
jgi:hypothetical protein